VKARSGPPGLRLVSVLTVIAVGLVGCGNGGSEDSATTATSAASTDTAVTATAAPNPEGTVRRARLPGPPGPAGPRGISEAIAIWHPLAEAGVPGGNCLPLLDSVQGRLGRDAARETGGAPYVSLYKGIAEGCLGRVQAARTSLGQARQVGLGPDEISMDATCNAQLLLVFGYATYLNEEISPTCPRATTTTRRSTTTTGASTTTTRGTTTTTRASTPTTR
jgi:hypothetical protein